MSPEISERSFEEAIECGLLEHGPDACVGDVTAVRETPPPYGDAPPGGYRKRAPRTRRACARWCPVDNAVRAQNVRREA